VGVSLLEGRGDEAGRAPRSRFPRPELPAYTEFRNQHRWGGPPADRFLTDDRLAPYGFPELVAKEFRQTATLMDAVVLTRVPGPAAFRLIADGHDMKSFYVHAKSCDWGPAAGFVCELPALNKKGAANMDFNLAEHLNTKRWIETLSREAYDQEVAAEAARARIRAAEDLREPQPPRLDDLREPPPRETPERARELARLTSMLAVPLTISTPACQRLYRDGYVDGRFTQADGQQRVGVAANRDGDTLLEFVLTEVSGGGWMLHHRQIWLADGDDPRRFTPYLGRREASEVFTLAQPGGDRLAVSTEPQIDIGEEAAGRLDQFRDAWLAARPQGASVTAPSPLPAAAAYPIRGLQNPYAPYPRGDPRNAVTGDYDLFAVWPRQLATRWEETVRYSEFRSTPPQVSPPWEPPELLRPVPRRHLTIALGGAPGVYIEVIPGFAEIAAYEDRVLGNINNAVHLTVGTLNSLLEARYQRVEHAVNAAFHSDEGGRPGVNEIEYPIAAFLPASIRNTDDRGGSLVVLDHGQLLDLLELIVGRCEIPLNFGWLMHLFGDLAEIDDLRHRAEVQRSRLPQPITRDTKKPAALTFFEKRLKFRADPAVTADVVAGLRARLARFLTGGSRPWGHPQLEGLSSAFLDSVVLQSDGARAEDMLTAIVRGAGRRSDG
jgi:hypothetical protein